MTEYQPKFEENEVGQLKKEIWEAPDEKIDQILKEFEIPSPGEMDKPGSYIQTTQKPIVQERLKKNDIVLIPLGSTEVHGHHSVSAQDLFQVTRIIEGVRRYTSKQGKEIGLAFPPTVHAWHPYHHIGMIGTIPISPRIFTQLLVDVMFGLWAMGYRKQIFINNHCGISPIIQAINEFRYRYPQLPIITIILDWCVIVGDFLRTKTEGGPFETHFVHSDEVETSIAMLLCPEMIRMEWAKDEAGKDYLPDGHFEKSAENLGRPNSWQARTGLTPQEVVQTPSGIVGKATLADPNKAKRAIAMILKYIVLLQNHILKAFPPGKLPPVEEITLFNKEEVEGYLKKPEEKGYKNPYQLWRPW